MYKYTIKIKKVSGRLNESVLPSKSIVVKSKTKKSDKQIFAEASEYFKNKYGLVIEMADISVGGSNPIISALEQFIMKTPNMKLQEITRFRGDKKRLLNAVRQIIEKLYKVAAPEIDEDAMTEWGEAKAEGLGLDYMIEEWASAGPGEIMYSTVDGDWFEAINNLCGYARIEFDESMIQGKGLGESIVTLLLLTDVDNAYTKRMIKKIIVSHKEMFR